MRRSTILVSISICTQAFTKIRKGSALTVWFCTMWTLFLRVISTCTDAIQETTHRVTCRSRSDSIRHPFRKLAVIKRLSPVRPCTRKTCMNYWLAECCALNHTCIKVSMDFRTNFGFGAAKMVRILNLIYVFFFSFETLFKKKDFGMRMIAKSICIRRPLDENALYRMFYHMKSEKNQVRTNLLFTSVIRMNSDGLSNINQINVTVLEAYKYRMLIHLKIYTGQPSSEYFAKYAKLDNNY